MVYEAFLETLTQDLQQALGEDFQFLLRPLPKNNGVTLDGLTIQGPGVSLAPTIYLNPYYDQFLQGMSMDEIRSDILHLYYTTPAPDFIREEDFTRFDQVKGKLMFRVIHTASNQVLLSDVPHLPYLDLSIIFFLALGRTDSGQLTTLVHNEHASLWGMDANGLWRYARENTPLEYPPSIRSMDSLLKEIARTHSDGVCRERALEALFSEKQAGSLPLSILTNASGLYGASCMLYQNVLKDFADRLGSDVIVLPSSVHEVLLTPDTSDPSYEMLSETVASINRRDVPLEDQLSNQVYLYTRADGRIRIVSQGDRPVIAEAAVPYYAAPHTPLPGSRQSYGWDPAPAGSAASFRDGDPFWSAVPSGPTAHPAPAWRPASSAREPLSWYCLSPNFYHQRRIPT